MMKMLSGVDVLQRRSLLSVVLCPVMSLVLMAHVATTVRITSPTAKQLVYKSKNQSVLFNCTISASVSDMHINKTFQWLRNDAVVSPAEREDTLQWSSFELKNLSDKDEGKYICIYGQNQDSVTFYFAIKPKARNVGRHSPILATTDDRVALRCEAEGWPRPDIYWLKDNKNISSYEKEGYYIENIPTKGSKVKSIASELTIVAAQPDNSGEFTCVAVNEIGVSKYNITVVVSDRPSPTYKPSMSAHEPKITTDVGKDALLSCTGEQVMEYTRATRLYWMLNGTTLDTSAAHYNATNTFYHQDDGLTPSVEMRLMIFDVRWPDAGVYICGVDSTLGQANDKITLTVKDKERNGIWIILCVSVAVTVVVLIVALYCYLISKHRRRQRKMAMLAEKYTRDGSGEHFHHDVFVSYSSKDYDWIQDNLQPVFDQNNINYIIHSRDFIPGKAFFDNMADSVYSSRKVILVMSKNYLASGFCKDEMHMALVRAARNDEAHSLIVVKIDDVKPQNIPKSLRHKTFIDYASREESTTWKTRIVEFVLSGNRSLSVSAVAGEGETSDTISLFLSKFRLKPKKKEDVWREYQSC